MPVVAEVMPERMPVLMALAFVSRKRVCAKPVMSTDTSHRVDPKFQRFAGDSEENPGAERQADEYARIEEANKFAVSRAEMRRALYEIAREADEQHEGNGILRIVKEHEKRRKHDGEAETREGLQQ